MYYYALSLRTASFLMANGTWTKNHVDSIVLHHRDGLLDALHTFHPFFSFITWLFFPAGASAGKESRIVYPPCPTSELEVLKLEGREKVILSIAQFRCVS